MIKVKDGYGKLIGTTYQGSATLVLLSNGGNLEFSSATKANTLVLRNASLHIYATYFNSAISDEALTDIGSVYIRNTSDTFIRRISKTQFYSIIDNKFVTLDTALTITGVKTFSTGPILANNATITLNLNSTGNYTTVVKWLKGGTSQGTYNPSIGLHNTGGDGKGSICILPYPTETSPWGGTVGLFISKGVLRLDGKAVAIADNYYTKTESDNRYVNVTGDTMTGPLIVKASITGTLLISNIANGTAPLKVTSKTVVTNLNSDLLDGHHETSFFRARGSLTIAGSIPTTTELSSNNNLSGNWNVSFPGASGHLVQFNTGGGSTRYMQFYSHYSGSLYWRNSTDSTLNTKPWKTIVDSANYTGIVLKIGTATKGSATLPIYLNAGTPTACNSTLTVSITGNAATATKLATARTINGTSFDGTANITTIKWGYARTLTLTGSITGSATIDGSGNVSMATTYLAGNIGNLDARYVNVTGDTMTGQLSWTMNGVTSSISNGNSSYTHYNTNASSGHWFNKNVHVSGNVYGGSSYNRILAFKDEINSQVGGSKSAQMNWASWDTGTYGGAIQIREQGLVTNKQSAWGYSPALTFHWGNRYAKRFGMRSDGQFAVDNVPISLSTHNHNSLYVTALGTNGNYVTWTKNGTTNNLTVPYATNADKLDNYHGALSNAASNYVLRDSDTSIQIGRIKSYSNRSITSTIQFDTNPGSTQYFQCKPLGAGTDSYMSCVILLMPVLTVTNTSSNNFIDGKFYLYKSGGNVYDVVDLSMNQCYNAVEYHISSIGQNGEFSLCRCTYGGINYYAIKVPYHANPYTHGYFIGLCRSDLAGGSTKLNLPLYLSYYKNNTSTATNTEINNSITSTLTTSIVTSVTHRQRRFSTGIIGNSTSATQLQTARTLWGQSFNGTANVSGNMSSVGSISMNAQITGGTYITTSQYIRAAGELQSTSANSLRIVYGNYGVFWRNDGSNYYLMTTASGSQYGSYNSLRPFYFNLASGRVTHGHGLTVTGDVTASSGFKKGSSSDSYVLLGGGGHKAISDFAVKNHNHNSLYVTALGTSGNYVTWTKNGTTNNLTVPYAERARQLSSYGQSPNNSHPGYGARIFYSWNIGQANNATAGYSNGITIGSNPGDTAYGFLIVLNMWDDRTYTRRYNSGWQTWKTLAWTSDILNPADYYWANIRISASSSTGTSPTFSTAYTSNWFRSLGATGWYSETYGGGWHMTDTTYIRAYGSKRVYTANTSLYAFYTSGGMTAAKGFLHSAVNSNSYVLLAGGSYKSLGDFAKGNAGASNRGVYVTGGTVTAMTYYLNATVNSGTSGKLAYYSGANTLTSYTSTVGSSAKPIYLYAGSPSASSYSFTGTYSNPVIVWCGEIYRSSPSSTYWYSVKKGGCCNISFTTNNAASNGSLVISIPNCEPYAAFCSTVRIFSGSTPISAGDGVVDGRSAGMGDYMTLCNVSGTTGSVHIKKFGLRDKNNDSWTNGELKRTKTSDGNRPVARFYLTIVGRYI